MNLPSDAGWAASVERIGAHYDALVDRYGHDARACDYGRAESQRIKFAVLAQAIPLEGKRVLDVGCGFADFADYLAGIAPNVEYAGVDISPAMIGAARRLHPHLNLRELDILTDEPGGPFDLVTANGIFYLLGEEAEMRMQRLIARMFALCREAVAFTSLSAWAGDREAGEFYADPVRILDFCRTLTPYIRLRHDYLPHDFAVYLYRQRSAFEVSA